MKLHRLSPRDGWHVFVGEVGVIVLGVLIALVAQQVAENWQWRQTVARTKSDLEAQLSSSVANVAERTAVDRCLSARLTDLATKVAASRGEWKGDPYVLPGENSSSEIIHYVIPPAYRAPARSYPDAVWQQAKAAGVLAHLAPADIALYGLAFSDVDDARSSNADEGQLAAELSFLSFDGPLAASERSRALSTIAQLDKRNKAIVNAGRQLVADVRTIGSSLSAADEKILLDNLDIQAKFRGQCVDRAAALRLIAPIRAPGASRLQ